MRADEGVQWDIQCVGGGRGDRDGHRAGGIAADPREVRGAVELTEDRVASH